MRTISTALQTQLEAESARVFWLLAVGDDLRYTDADVTIYYGGNPYAPIGMRVDVGSGVGFGSEEVAVELDNVSRGLSAALLSADAHAYAAALSIVAVSSASSVIGAEEIYSGYVAGYHINESMCRLEIGSRAAFWARRSLRIPAPSCPWVFRGTECGYTGGTTWCDKSPEHCAALGNYSQFGGRKYIADIESREIYWGPR